MRPGGLGPGGRGPGGLGGPGGPRGQRANMASGKPKNTSTTIKRLLAYIGRDKLKILFVFACVICASLTNLGGSYVL
ncbi:MAG: ABC transporter ATP-binding protein, partial [Bacillota bacterium]